MLMVFTTVLSAVRITETELDDKFVTYTVELSGDAATDVGLLPTFTVATTALLRVEITETVLAPEFAT